MSLSTRSLTDAQDLMSMKKEGEPSSDRAMKLKTDWNDFVDFAEKRGLKGHPELDKGLGEENNGIRLVRQYQKENPNTLVTPENIAEIQTHFKNYRDYSINQLRTKKAQLTDAQNPTGRYVTPDENLDFYMKDLSKIDGIPGSRTTSWRFPKSFLTTIYKNSTGKVEKTTIEDQGIVKS